MPRAKAIERRRCLLACDVCKKRKEKCDGLLPCSNCKRHNREDSCGFVGRRRTLVSRSPQLFEDQMDERIGSIDDENSAIPRLENVSQHSVEIDVPPYNNLSPPGGAPVPKLSRMLRDMTGKFIYIGDSASLSFLQTIRRVVDTTIGPCNFTTDKLRHQLIEASPKLPESISPDHEPKLESGNLLDLANHFFVAGSGLLDLFDTSFIVSRIPALVEDPMSSQWPDCPLFYLVFAIGAQVRGRDSADNYVAEQFFNLARHQLSWDAVDDPSLATVQGFCLVAWYLLTTSRRNGALMNLGIAVQAAYALGIHRHEANVTFGVDVALSRERAWKSLRVCDLFLSASLGRPSTTSNVDCNIPFAAFTAQNDYRPIPSRLSSAMTSICLIFERILSEVYSTHAVSLELATSISKQHRKWTEELPRLLYFDKLSESQTSSSFEATGVVGRAVVVMAYYYSIILLTRPFLTFYVHSISKNRNHWKYEDRQNPAIISYADACVNAAIKGMAVVQSLSLDRMPKRMPVVVNHVFISALTLGLAYFADYDCRGWVLDDTLVEALAILGYYGVHNPQAARYKQIIEYLQAAARQYKYQRDSNSIQLRNQQLHNVFGSVSLETGANESSTTPGRQSTEVSSLHTLGPTETEVQVLLLQDGERMLQSSLITTAGFPAPQPSSGRNIPLYHNLGSDGDWNQLDFQFANGNYVPLFSVMDESSLQENSNYQDWFAYQEPP